uniref:Pr1-like protein n=1 Tax=Oryza sativa subsp. japonica TaxID=39947 RepID=Q851B7_ORYSJ|nr:hypothetical protein [Oryza sativa Japonica Group]
MAELDLELAGDKRWLVWGTSARGVPSLYVWIPVEAPLVCGADRRGSTARRTHEEEKVEPFWSAREVAQRKGKPRRLSGGSRVYCVSRGEGARGPGPREWGPRGSLTVHGGPGALRLTPAGAVGPTCQPHPRARAADGRAPRGSRSVDGEDEKAAGAEEGGCAARVDGDGGAPAVDERNGGVDEVGEDAAKPKEAALRWEVVWGDDGGGPELGGDGGEKATARARFRRGGRSARGGNGRRRCGEGLNRVGRGRERPAAGFAAAAALGRGRGGGSGGRKGMTGGPHPSARVAGGPARQRRARGERPDGPRGKEREREGKGTF